MIELLPFGDKEVNGASLPLLLLVTAQLPPPTPLISMLGALDIDDELKSNVAKLLKSAQESASNELAELVG